MSNSPGLPQYMSLFLSFFFSFSEWWKWFTVTHAVPHYFFWYVGWENQWEDLEQGTKTVVYALFVTESSSESVELSSRLTVPIMRHHTPNLSTDQKAAWTLQNTYQDSNILVLKDMRDFLVIWQKNFHLLYASTDPAPEHQPCLVIWI